MAKFIKAKGRGITLRDIGQGTDQRIYIHECLSKSSRELLQFALQLKRQKRLASVFSIRGRLFVRAKLHTDAIRVTSKAEIECTALKL